MKKTYHHLRHTALGLATTGLAVICCAIAVS